MPAVWSSERLDALDRTRELLIAAPAAGGRMRDPVPVWVVVVGAEVLVRTWYPRDTGWYGAARRSARARIEVQGAAVDVVVDTELAASAAAVDAAYRRKYGGGADSMVTPDAVSSTLRLTPEP